ncbi:D-alanine-D-alanine ligase [Longilinea arvoryzae]|uniref:D-alanine-D-alanine ligase n=1 Tax=Longilinea arvoryzae TaxID=360412 RepID=A0A0S7BA68_9CHLR|nr:ATP-grasp domain-containing protein [Longilinea arvoryzae]GAP14479.1 D-alanine-D-alanine ligase [Longilinea arvoryzae]
MNEEQPLIALVYNLENETVRGKDQDRLALQSTAGTAERIYQALRALKYDTIKIPVENSAGALKVGLRAFSPRETFVFNLCDGCGDDLQGESHVTEIIESMGFSHTGSFSETIALCTDKARIKRRLIEAGLPTPAFGIFRHPAMCSHLNYPVIVKPMLEDGSIGISMDSVTTNLTAMNEQIAYITRKYAQPALVEEFIPGRELAVSLWGNQNVEALPIVEEDYSHILDPLEHLLTYESKWVADDYLYQNVKPTCPAVMNETDRRTVIETAVKTYLKVGLCDFGRIDMRLYQGIPYIIDINEIPDLDPDSGYPRSARAAGISYTGMVAHILDLALRRQGWRVMDECAL